MNIERVYLLLKNLLQIHVKQNNLLTLQNLFYYRNSLPAVHDGWMRHQLRYHMLNVGVLYRGEGNMELLEEWCERCAKNLGGKSLGVISLDKTGKEVASCM